MAQEHKAALIDGFRDDFQRVWGQIETMLPEVVPAQKFKIVAWRTVVHTPKLLECDSKSLLGSLVQCAQLGLMPGGVTHEASILPFREKSGRLIATLVPEYRGILKLARNSGYFTTIHAHAVYEKDEFEYWFGLEKDHLRHVPCTDEDPGEVIYAYAIARLKEGGAMMRVLPRREIERSRQSSKAPNSPAWVNWYMEMAEKTALKKIGRHLPLSSELATGLALAEVEEGPVEPTDLGHLVPAGAFATEYEEKSKSEALAEELEERIGDEPHATVGGKRAADIIEPGDDINDPVTAHLVKPSKGETASEEQLRAVRKVYEQGAEARAWGAVDFRKDWICGKLGLMPESKNLDSCWDAITTSLPATAVGQLLMDMQAYIQEAKGTDEDWNDQGDPPPPDDEPQGESVDTDGLGF